MTHPHGHTAPTSCACSSPSGTAIASGSYDRSIILWDSERGEPIRRLSGHTALVNGVDWSPDGQMIGSASSDHTARIWDASSGRELALLEGHRDDVNAIRFSPSGNHVATASFDGTVRVWSVKGQCLLIAGHHAADVNSVAWFPDGRRLAACSDDRTVSVFDVGDGRIRKVLGGHLDWVDDIAIDPTGRMLASACLDGSLSIWDTVSGERRFHIDDARCVVKAVAFSPDGSELASAAYDGCIRIYETQRFSLRATLRHEGLWNRTLAWTPRGWLTGSFASGPSLLAEDGARDLGRQSNHGINSFTLAGNDTALICSDDGGVYAMDLARRCSLGQVAHHRAAVLCVTATRDGSRFATGSWDRRILVWDRNSKDPIAEWQGLGDPVNAIAFDATGNHLFAGTFNGDIIAWDLERNSTRVLGKHQGSVKSIAASKNGIVSVGRDGRVKSFERGRARCFRAGSTILNDVSLSGERLATASRRDGVQLWQTSGELIGAFSAHPCSAKSVAFAGDGSRIGASYYDGTVGLWNPQTGETQLRTVAEASLSKIAPYDRGFLVSAWDRAGSLIVVDSSGNDVARMSVAA